MTAISRASRAARLALLGRSRRQAELGLIIIAIVIVGGAFTLASLGKTASVPGNIGAFMAVIAGLMLVPHLAVRRLAPTADGLLLPLVAVLNGIGYVFIVRLKPGLAAQQATWTFIGVAAFVLTLLVVKRARDLESYRYTFLLMGVGLLILPFIPGIGVNIRGARIWAHLGPISFQPGEFAKLAFALFFASYLVEKRELLAMATWPKFRPMLPDLKHLGPVLLAWGIAILVMTAQNDLGSSLLFFVLFMSMLWVATNRIAYPLGGAVMFGGAAYAAYTQFSHVQQRVQTWLNPWDYERTGYQVIQSWYALAWGGLTGTGLGLGRPDKVPIVESDMIFSAIGEELGLLGGTAILIAYLLIVGSGLRIAVQSEHAFDKLLAAGLTTLIGVQAFVILGGVTRLLPLTGVVLPFVSYGGSALVANYVLIALLIRVSDGNRRSVDKPAKASKGRRSRAAASAGAF